MLRVRSNGLYTIDELPANIFIIYSFQATCLSLKLVSVENVLPIYGFKGYCGIQYFGYIVRALIVVFLFLFDLTTILLCSVFASVAYVPQQNSVSNVFSWVQAGPGITVYHEYVLLT